MPHAETVKQADPRRWLYVPLVMGKLKLKKAGKVMRRAGEGAVRAMGMVAKVAEAIVIAVELVEKAQKIAERRPASPGGDGHGRSDRNPDA